MNTPDIPDLDAIDRGRRESLDNDLPNRVISSAHMAITELLAYARACRALLAGLEASSMESCRYWPGDQQGYCPECLASIFRPGPDTFEDVPPRGHKDGCELARLIGVASKLPHA